MELAFDQVLCASIKKYIVLVCHNSSMAKYSGFIEYADHREFVVYHLACSHVNSAEHDLI